MQPQLTDTPWMSLSLSPWMKTDITAGLGRVKHTSVHSVETPGQNCCKMHIPNVQQLRVTLKSFSWCIISNNLNYNLMPLNFSQYSAQGSGIAQRVRASRRVQDSLPAELPQAGADSLRSSV